MVADVLEVDVGPGCCGTCFLFFGPFLGALCKRRYQADCPGGIEMLVWYKFGEHVASGRVVSVLVDGVEC